MSASARSSAPDARASRRRAPAPWGSSTGDAVLAAFQPGEGLRGLVGAGKTQEAVLPTTNPRGARGTYKQLAA
jgi:hypothetical protein